MTFAYILIVFVFLINFNRNQHLRKRFGTLPQHVFIGYHDDMAAIVVLRVMNMLAAESDIPEVRIWFPSDCVYRIKNIGYTANCQMFVDKWRSQRPNVNVIQIFSGY